MEASTPASPPQEEVVASEPEPMQEGSTSKESSQVGPIASTSREVWQGASAKGGYGDEDAALSDDEARADWRVRFAEDIVDEEDAPTGPDLFHGQPSSPKHNEALPDWQIRYADDIVEDEEAAPGPDEETSRIQTHEGYGALEHGDDSESSVGDESPRPRRHAHPKLTHGDGDGEDDSSDSEDELDDEALPDLLDKLEAEADDPQDDAIAHLVAIEAEMEAEEAAAAPPPADDVDEDFPSFEARWGDRSIREGEDEVPAGEATALVARIKRAICPDPAVRGRTNRTEWLLLDRQWHGEEQRLSEHVGFELTRGTEYDLGFSNPLTSPVLFLLAYPVGKQRTWQDPKVPTCRLLRAAGIFELALQREQGHVCLFDYHNHPHTSSPSSPDTPDPLRGIWPCGEDVHGLHHDRTLDVLQRRSRIHTQQLVIASGAGNHQLVREYARKADRHTRSYEVVVSVPAKEGVHNPPTASLWVLTWRENGCEVTALLVCHPSYPLYASLRGFPFPKAYNAAYLLDQVVLDLRQALRLQWETEPDVPRPVFSRVRRQPSTKPAWIVVFSLIRRDPSMSRMEIARQVGPRFLAWVDRVVQEQIRERGPSDDDFSQPLRVVARAMARKTRQTHASRYHPVEHDGEAIVQPEGVPCLMSGTLYWPGKGGTSKVTSTMPSTVDGHTMTTPTGVPVVSSLARSATVRRNLLVDTICAPVRHKGMALTDPNGVPITGSLTDAASRKAADEGRSAIEPMRVGGFEMVDPNGAVLVTSAASARKTTMHMTMNSSTAPLGASSAGYEDVTTSTGVPIVQTVQEATAARTTMLRLSNPWPCRIRGGDCVAPTGVPLPQRASAGRLGKAVEAEEE